MLIPLRLLEETFVAINQFDKTLKSSGLTIASVITSNKGERELALELNQKVDFSDALARTTQLRSDFENGIIHGRPDDDEGDLFFKKGPKFIEMATQTPMSHQARKVRSSGQQISDLDSIEQKDINEGKGKSISEEMSHSQSHNGEGKSKFTMESPVRRVSMSHERSPITIAKSKKPTLPAFNDEDSLETLSQGKVETEGGEELSDGEMDMAQLDATYGIEVGTVGLSSHKHATKLVEMLKPKKSLKNFLHNFRAKAAKEEENKELEGKLMAEINELREAALQADEMRVKIKELEENAKVMQTTIEKKSKDLIEQNKKIDLIVEQRFKQMVLKNANDKRKGTFLEIKSGMDKRAEEKRLIMLMRQKEHEKKFAEKKAVEAKAKAEAEAKAAEEKRLALLGSDDERSLDSNGLPKKHVPKVAKLKIEGDELETKKLEEREAREIKLLIQKEMDEIEIKANSVYIKAADTNTVGTSTHDLLGNNNNDDDNLLYPLVDSNNIVSALSPVYLEPHTTTTDPNVLVNVPQDKDITSRIANAENPILHIYLHFGPLIRDEWKSKLLHASAMEAATIQTPKLVTQIFDVIEGELKNFQEEAFKTLRNLIVCEKSGLSLINLKHADHLKDFMGPVFEFFNLLGELEAKYVSLEMKALEYRKIFELLQQKKVQLGEEGETNFERCYRLFVVNQSKTTELHNRLKTLKQACERARLAENLKKIDRSNFDERMKGAEASTEGKMLDDQSIITSQSIISSYHERIALERANNQSSIDKEEKDASHLATDNIHAAKKTIELLHEEIELLKLDLFEAEQLRDRTPGALLFFAALYDPAAVTAVSNVSAELKAMKGVCDGSEYLDYHSLRKKLLICISNAPSLERLVTKFQKMHTSWTQSRAKLFSSRNQAGGDADTTYACPLCCNDSRLISKSLPSLPVQKDKDVHQNQHTGKLLSIKRSASAKNMKEQDPDFTLVTKENNPPQLQRPLTSPIKRSKSMLKVDADMKNTLRTPSTSHGVRYKQNLRYENSSADDDMLRDCKSRGGVLRDSKSRGDVNNIHASLSANSTASIENLPSLTKSQTEKIVRNQIKVRNW